MGFFNGGGATLTFGDTRDPNSWPQFGNRWRGGQIVEILDVQPQTDMKTKEKIIRNGKVAEQLPVVLLCDGSGPAQGMNTDERNSQDQADIGRRMVYVKGSLRYSIGDALRAAQADDISVGGYLFMMWTGMGKSGNSDFIGRTWQVHYIKPSGAFLQQQTNAANPMQSAPPAVPGQGAMPVQQNAQGQFAPQHTGFAPTQTPAAAPPQQGWSPAQAAPVVPPNPYGQHNPPGSPAANAAQQWQAQSGQYPADAHTAAAQMTGGFPPANAPDSAAPASNPWGQGQEAQNAPQAPYGPPGGAPVTPPAGNPWQQ